MRVYSPDGVGVTGALAAAPPLVDPARGLDSPVSLLDPFRCATDGFDVDVPLRERDLDARPDKLLVDGLVQQVAAATAL